MNFIYYLFAVIGIAVTILVLLPASVESVSRKLRLGGWQFDRSLKAVLEGWASKL